MNDCDQGHSDDDSAPGTSRSDSPRRLLRPSMLGFVNDAANLITLAGLSCGVGGIYFAIRGIFPAAMIAMLWAVLFDWFDGSVARRMHGRTDEFRAFGGQLDSLVDMVSSAVFPAVVLLCYGQFSPWFLPGALMLTAAGAVRLSYFNVFGLGDDSTFLGLSIDNNSIVVPLVFLLDGLLSRSAFAAVLYTTIVVLAILNVAPFRMPKLGGSWHFVITAYVLGLTVLYGWRLV